MSSMAVSDLSIEARTLPTQLRVVAECQTGLGTVVVAPDMLIGWATAAQELLDRLEEISGR